MLIAGKQVFGRLQLSLV